jgi:hypothetical protein
MVFNTTVFRAGRLPLQIVQILYVGCKNIIYS